MKTHSFSSVAEAVERLSFLAAFTEDAYTTEGNNDIWLAGNAWQALVKLWSCRDYLGNDLISLLEEKILFEAESVKHWKVVDYKLITEKVVDDKTPEWMKKGYGDPRIHREIVKLSKSLLELKRVQEEIEEFKKTGKTSFVPSIYGGIKVSDLANLDDKELITTFGL